MIDRFINMFGKKYLDGNGKKDGNGNGNGKKNTNANATTTKVTLNQKQKSILPKIDIKNVLNAVQSEDMNLLIPLYALFIKRDAHLSSEIRKRRRQILSLKFLIESDNDEVKKFIENYIDSIDMQRLIYDLTLGIPYGFTILNIVYDNIDKNIYAPKEFHTIHPRYVFIKDGEIMLKKDKNDRLKIDDDPRFLIHIHPEDSGDLPDYGVMSNLLVISAMKHYVMTSNMQYFEMLGVPPLYVNSDISTEDEARDLLDQVSMLRSSAMGIFAKDVKLNLLHGQAGRTEFLKFIEYCDQQISHNIMGNTLSGNQDSTGSYSLGVIHDNRRKDVLVYDARMIERSLQKIIRTALELNGFKKSKFRTYFDTGDEKDEMHLATVYKTLTESGYDIPVEHIEDMFNIKGITKRKS